MKNILFVFLVLVLIVFSCRKDENFITDNSAQLEFSIDTLHFDTVFTSVGSSTRIIKAFNRHEDPIRISRIWLDEGDASFFRMNVDGIPTRDIDNIEIAAKDSLYIFAEVTINPELDPSDSPFVINEELRFETNGNQQKVVLEAWGQNANYIPDIAFKQNSLVYNLHQLPFYPCELGQIVWDDPRPYVIYGVMVIDSCTLTLPPGTSIYIHGGFGRTEADEEGSQTIYNDGLIFVNQDGRLNIQGTVDNPVTIQSDRLEVDFEEEPGQWAGIRISSGSTNNTVNHTMIRHSIVGFRVDSAAELSIKNTQIFNTSGSGLLALHATVDAENCLFYNNNGNNVQLEYGGNYNFDYCTLASYGVESSALRMSNFLCLDPFCTEFRFNALSANWKNSIIFGSRKDEIDLADAIGDQLAGQFNYDFKNCIVKVEDLLDEEQFPTFFEHCNPCINADNNETLFVDVDEDDYHLDTLSVAEKQAMPIPTIFLDLDGQNRDMSTPDLGCYEYLYQ